MFGDHTKEALDPTVFPYTKSQLLVGSGGSMGDQENEKENASAIDLDIEGGLLKFARVINATD